MTAFDHAGLKALAKQLGRPLYTLEVLRNDPFTAGQPARKAGAEWAAALWRRFEIKPGAHIRRVHYKIISQRSPVLMANGEPYINTERCEEVLNRASLDARYLGLINSSDLVDRRNAEPIINLIDGRDGFIFANGGVSGGEPPGLTVPRLIIAPPLVAQRYHLEIWIEKSTMNDVVEPLTKRYGSNFVYAIGEQSQTNCVQLVDRAQESGRPVRVLYGSDFDPGGVSMPVAVARKIEHELYKEARERGLHDLDIQVRPVVLTYDQCVDYQLPRKPIKETETRAAAFEARFGEGATELDALEALYPGELARILERETARYYDPDLAARVEETTAGVQADLNQINTRIHKRHATAIAAIEAERKKVIAAIAAFEKKTRPLLRKIERDLEADAPVIDEYEWPVPDHGDEDPDPLFDSTREYLDQIDRYKEHQGKPTEATTHERICANPKCGKSFAARSSRALTCSVACKSAVQRSRRRDAVAGAGAPEAAS
jgi:hypothetical protein